LGLARRLSIYTNERVRIKKFFQSRPLARVLLSHHTEDVFEPTGRRTHFKNLPELSFVLACGESFVILVSQMSSSEGLEL